MILTPFSRARFSKIILLFLLLFLLGCASSSYYRREGIYHKVKRGETLWRISKTYNVSMRSIMRANRISNPTRIKAGAKLFIPGAKEGRRIKPYKPGKKEDIRKGDFAWPVKGRVISTFGMKGKFWNPGINIAAPKGTRVGAAKKGIVVYCEENMRGYGRVIMIEHKGEYMTVYAHNLVNLVEEGQEVRRGETIARVGISPRASEPCLHFEIRKKGEARNPLYYLP